MNKAASTDQSFLDSLYKTIEDNLLNEQFGVEELAREIGISRTQLHRKLQNLTGQSTSQLIREYRLKKAKELLENESATVAEVSYQVGFGSPSYFNTCFHEHFGYSPGEVKIRKSVEEKRNVDEAYEEEEAVVNNSNQPSKRNLVPFLVIAGMSVVVAMILIWQFLPSTNQESSTKDAILDKSIAVLPFRNDSPDQDNEYLCNGIMEEILTHLQRIKDMRVKSRTTSELYRNPEKDPISIATELEVAFVLEGSVRKVGDDIRINVQLVDAGTGDQLWAEIYDGTYSIKILDFQTDVANKITASLNAVITPEEEQRIDHKSTSEIMAYDLYWKGMDMESEYKRSNDLKYLELANELYDKALRIDPNYVEAIYGKGHAHIMEDYNTNGNCDSAMIYADRAIKIDPENGLGYFLKGSCYSWMGKIDLAIDNYLKAIELEANLNWSTVNIGRQYCIGKHDFATGIPYIEKAMKLEGRNPAGIFHFAGDMFLHLGDYNKAIECYQNSINLDPICNGNIVGYSRTLASQRKLKELQNFTDSICDEMDCEAVCARLRFWVKFINKDYKEAEIYLNRFIHAGGSPDLFDSVKIAFVNKKLRNETESMAIVEKIISSYEYKLKNNLGRFPWRILYNLSSVHALLDEKKEALKYLSMAVAVDGGLLWGYNDFLEIDPTFEHLWDDPAFKAIVKKAQDEKAAIRAQIREMEERGELDL